MFLPHLKNRPESADVQPVAAVVVAVAERPAPPSELRSTQNAGATPSEDFSAAEPEPAAAIADTKPATEPDTMADDTFDDFERRETAVVAFGRELAAQRVATVGTITAEIRPFGNGFMIVWTDPDGSREIVRGRYGFELNSHDRAVDYAVQKAREIHVVAPEELDNGSTMERRYHKRRGAWCYVVTRPHTLSRTQFADEERKAQNCNGWYARQYKPEFQAGGFLFMERADAVRFANDYKNTGRRSGAEETKNAKPATPSEDFSESPAVAEFRRLRDEILSLFQPDGFGYVAFGIRHHAFVVRRINVKPATPRDSTECVEYVHTEPDGTTTTVSDCETAVHAFLGIVERLRVAFKLPEFASESGERKDAESRVKKFGCDYWHVDTFAPNANSSGFPSGSKTKRAAVEMAFNNRRMVLRRLAGDNGGTYTPFYPSEDFSDTAKAGRQSSPESERIAERLETLADGMQKKIDERHRPMTQNYTHKRGREYRSRVHEGDNLKRCQEALRVLAQHWRAGTIPETMRDLKSITNVLPLVSCCWDSSRDYGTDTPRITTALAVELRNMVTESRSPEFAAQLRQQKRAAEIRIAEDALRLRNVPGFFPTPAPLAGRMIEEARIPDTPAEDFSVLEPSAGIGSIVDTLAAAGFPADRVECFEASQACGAVLTLKGYRNAIEDFLSVEPAERFDRVLMNPPFEAQADIDHVRHAFQFLKPGGRLVAIMSEGSFNTSTRRKCQEFALWLTDKGGTSEPIRGAFDSSAAFRTTGVSVRLVVIDKD